MSCRGLLPPWTACQKVALGMEAAFFRVADGDGVWVYAVRSLVRLVGVVVVFYAFLNF